MIKINFKSTVRMLIMCIMLGTLFLANTSDAFAKKAKTKTSKIDLSGLGCSLKGELRIIDKDGDGEYDSWEFEGEIKLPWGGKKKVKTGGELSLVEGSGNSGGLQESDFELPPEGEGELIYVTDETDFGFSVPIVDTGDTNDVIGYINFIINPTGNDGLVFINSTTSKATMSATDSKKDLNIKIISSNNHRIEYEFNAPDDNKLIEFYLFDVMGKVTDSFGFGSNAVGGRRICSFDNVPTGTYYIYSPVANGVTPVVVTE